ncbi:MAG: hypothetical protein E7668_07110 [Ruminococcaceae bacterium]|nr:hypothetical protein [Oscillospiraceae bacterium]
MNEMNEFETEAQQEMIQTEAPKETNFASAGFILTIIAICIAAVPFLNLFFLWYALVPLIVGTIALIKKEPARGKAIFAVLSPIISFVITVVVLIVTVLVIGAISTLSLNSFNQSSTKIEDAWEEYADVSFQDFEAKKDGTKLTVVVKNKSKETRDFVVKIEALDEDGNRIDTDKVTLEDIGAGKTKKIDAFTSVKEKNLDKMKDAEFRVIDVSVK